MKSPSPPVSARWFRLEPGPEFNVELMRPPSGHWPFSVLREQPLPLEITSDVVSVGGPGSVAMYAHVGAWAAAHGARRLHIRQPQANVTYDGATTAGSDLGSLARIEPDIAVLRLELPRSPQRSLSELVSIIPRFDGVRRLVVSGSGPVGLFASIAFAAVNAGAAEISVFVVSAGFVVAWHGESAWIGHVQDETENPDVADACGTRIRGRGVALGVVGDPNTGKSVLSGALNAIRENLALPGWRFDCDLATPTAPWFLDLVGDGREVDARSIRQQTKLPWTPEMEELAAQKLERAKRNAGLVVADLPGGRHCVDPPVRIPATRAPLFLAVDSFVLIGRADDASRTAWRAELQRLGVTERIVAELTSKNPGGPPGARASYGDDGVLRGVIEGLDRSRSLAELMDALRDPFGPLLVRLTEDA